LIIIGNGRHGSRYRQQAHGLGLERNVTFTGKIDHQSIHKHYWASDVFVLASRLQINPSTGLRDAETMGRVLCEANAAGLPTLAARSGGIPSVIENQKNGLLFSPDDKLDFLRCSIRLRYDRPLRCRIKIGGLRRANERFDWSVILAAHEHYFALVLGESVDFAFDHSRIKAA
jgi:glycosyltransferase involved in cell wall biosynthesis